MGTMRSVKAVNTLIISLLILTSFMLIFSVDTSRADGNKIFVKGDYPYATGNGSADRPYQSIQYAIDVANEGDTIFIFEGSYNETITIDKKISLIGLDRDNVTIEKNDIHKYTIKVTADYVTLESFTISDTSNNNLVALIYVTGNNVVIQGANITKCKTWGVYFDSSSDNTVGSNLINDTNVGVYLPYSDNNVFSNNSITNCSDTAIKMNYANNNIIYNNYLEYNYYGIYAYYSSDNNVTNNSVNNTQFTGVKFHGGLNNIVRFNHINNSGSNGITVSSADSKMRNNTLEYNQVGISVGASDCEVHGNLINNSYLRGVETGSGTQNCVFSLNQFTGNKDNAHDGGANMWYDEDTGQGNYWDDYGDVDSNHDGIGDVSYSVPGGGVDLYPLGFFLKPPDKPVDPYPADNATGVGLAITLKVNVTDPDSDYLSVYFYRATDNKLFGTRHYIESGETASISFTLDFQTNFPWYAIANDTKQENRSDIWIFTTRQIPPINKKPRADPGGPYEIMLGEAVTFDASGSYDPDGIIDFYRWNFGDGTSEILDIAPTHIYDPPGNYTVTLTVVDNNGTTATNITYVNVTSTPSNVAPVSDPGGPYTVKAKAVLTLDGSKSSDTDGIITNYSWVFTDGTIKYGTTITHTFTTPGSYTVTLIVTDDDRDTGINFVIVTVEKAEDTPGFEIILALCALALVFLLIKHKRKNYV
jgi:parallel beta-helix repeat protein